MWYPQWLYQFTPAIYAALGIFTTYQVDNIIGKLSGMVLVLAGVLIVYLRLTANSVTTVHTTRRSHPSARGRRHAHQARAHRISQRKIA